MLSIRSCGHTAPAICTASACRDWREAYRLDICCYCQAGRRAARVAAWEAAVAEAKRRDDIRRQLGYVRQARGTIAVIRRQLQRKPD